MQSFCVHKQVLSSSQLHFSHKNGLMILALLTPHFESQIWSRGITQLKSLNYFVSKAAALELSPPTLHLYKQASLLRGLICSSPAVNLIEFNSLETITHCFHLIVSDKRLGCRLSVHLSSEISLPAVTACGRIEPVWCLCSTPVQSRLPVLVCVELMWVMDCHLTVHQHAECWFSTKKNIILIKLNDSFYTELDFFSSSDGCT